MERIYLDNAATTRLAPEVLDKMMPWLTAQYGNASSTHYEGRAARFAIESARKSVAAHIGCSPASVFFTSGGTEGNNIAIRSFVHNYRISNIITSRTEHPSVLSTVRDLQHRGQVKLSYVGLREDGSVDLCDLDRLLEAEHGRTLVTLMFANNEIGALLNLHTAGEICRRHKAFFHSDCVQGVGHYAFNLRETPVDVITASGHKFHGPKGSGILYVREGMELRGAFTGGGQERSVRPGTENVSGIVGFAEALSIAFRNMAEDSYRINEIKFRMVTALRKLGVDFNGNVTNGLYTVLSAAFPKNEMTEGLLLQLDIAGIAASGGSACSAGKGGSHVMEAIGAVGSENIRFSFSKYNTVEEIERVEAILQKCLVSELKMVF